ncbi:MAG: hypothetical protein WBN79_05260 [Gemmatimonadota bacterium]|jgi:hypothetical protein
MKLIRITWCLAAAALVLGCEQTTEPPAQAEAVDLPAFAAERTDLIREFIWDWEDFIPCANGGEGEWVLWDGIIRWHQIRRDNPAGLHHRQNKEIAFIGHNHDHFMAFGQTTGDVWIVDEDKSQWNARRNNKGDFQNFHQNYKFVLVNVADGSVLNVQGVRNAIRNKDGEVIMEEDFNGSCPQTW